ncbi:MAG: DotI/IcmL family type IV secretion protein [Desulfovibrio sp.]|nr:DotI/IcmL family type IV secretion protein [Desulfovibrio sp.]
MACERKGGGESLVFRPGFRGVVHGLAFQEAVLRKLVLLLFVMALVILLLLAGLLCFALREEHPLYFGVNQEMQVIPMYPLNEPMYTDGALTSWAAQAATALFNLDFLHWREQLASQREYFTKEAFVSYRRSLADEGHLRVLSQYKALMHGVVHGMPTIVAAGVLDGRMTWEVEVPFTLAYETSSKVLSEQNVVLCMRIRREATSEYVKGIAIVQLVVEAEKRG